jgi:hypothetical protein
VWEPHAPANTSIASNHHTHKLSPYTDLRLKGKVRGACLPHLSEKCTRDGPFPGGRNSQRFASAPLRQPCTVPDLGVGDGCGRRAHGSLWAREQEAMRSGRAEVKVARDLLDAC